MKQYSSECYTKAQLLDTCIFMKIQSNKGLLQGKKTCVLVMEDYENGSKNSTLNSTSSLKLYKKFIFALRLATTQAVNFGRYIVCLYLTQFISISNKSCSYSTRIL